MHNSAMYAILLEKAVGERQLKVCFHAQTSAVCQSILDVLSYI